MSDPLSDTCAYCGSEDVLDDAWFCDRPECWDAWQEDEHRWAAYEARTPLTRNKASADTMATKAAVWGTPLIAIRDAVEQIVLLVRT